MNNILRVVATMSVWSVLVAAIIYVDPDTIRNVGVPQIYLPMIILVGIVVGYTIWQFVGGWKMIVSTLFVMVLTGLLLLL